MKEPIILTLFGLIFRRIFTYIYICTIYTRLDTCIMSISTFSLRDKVTRRLLKLYVIKRMWSSGQGRWT